jgi:hypothetical protein
MVDLAPYRIPKKIPEEIHAANLKDLITDLYPNIMDKTPISYEPHPMVECRPALKPHIRKCEHIETLAR